MITNTGLEYIAKNTCGLSSNAFIYFATGAGSTDESADDTALASENTLYGSARKIATCTFTSPSTAIWTATFAFTGDVTVREYGIFDDGGHLLARKVLSENQYFHDTGAGTFTYMIPFARVVA
jgi:hypothetical protein